MVTVSLKPSSLCFGEQLFTYIMKPMSLACIDTLYVVHEPVTPQWLHSFCCASNIWNYRSGSLAVRADYLEQVDLRGYGSGIGIFSGNICDMSVKLFSTGGVSVFGNGKSLSSHTHQGILETLCR